MPVVLRDGPYPFFFYSGDRDGPQHVHVAREKWNRKILAELSKNSRERRTEAI